MRPSRWLFPVMMLGVWSCAGAATPEQGVAFNPPPAKSVIETSAGRITVDSVNGYDVRVQKRDGGFETHHALLVKEEGGDVSYSRRAVEGFWPLRVGKSETINYSTSGGAREMNWKVLRTETVTVPAGTFYTYVIQHLDRAMDGHYEAVETSWYAPELGYFVRFQQNLVNGTQSQAKPNWELVSFKLPGRAENRLGRRMDTASNRAEFCREQGTAVKLADGRLLAVDCPTYVQIQETAYLGWLGQ